MSSTLPSRPCRKALSITCGVPAVLQQVSGANASRRRNDMASLLEAHPAAWTVRICAGTDKHGVHMVRPFTGLAVAYVAEMTATMLAEVSCPARFVRSRACNPPGLLDVVSSRSARIPIASR